MDKKKEKKKERKDVVIKLNLLGGKGEIKSGGK